MASAFVAPHASSGFSNSSASSSHSKDHPPDLSVEGKAGLGDEVSISCRYSGEDELCKRPLSGLPLGSMDRQCHLCHTGRGV